MDSILNSTKKILGISPNDLAFDLDIITHINASFSVLEQLGVGPVDGFSIEDDSTNWSDYVVPANQLHMVRTYIFLTVRMKFDPPGTSYLIEETNRQIAEFEWRLNHARELALEEGAA